MRASAVAYALLVAVVAVLLGINVHMCGLDAPTHTLRMRNVTYPTGYQGLTTETTQDYPTYMEGVSDRLRRLEFSIEKNEYTISDFDNQTVAGKLVRLQPSDDVAFGNFPLALVLNFTLRDDNEIRRLSFAAKEDVAQVDNGASFDIVLTNPKRKRITTPPPWFNRDYWNNTRMRLNYVLNDNGDPHLSICSGSMHLENGSSWAVADASSPITQLPLWFVDMSSIVQASQ